MMLKKIILLGLLVSTIVVNAQFNERVENIFPPSPEASALAEYAKIPVDMYTGVADIKLPVLSLRGNDLNIPITLSYHSAGIKVDEIASNVGLGWTLNTGGVITRVVRGKPDDHEYGYIGTNEIGKIITDQPFSALSSTYVAGFGTGSYDSEPDIYYFNVLGKSGRFTFDAYGNVVMMPEQDFKIIPPEGFGPNGTGSHWVVIDTNGTTYKFGVTSNSREESEVTTIYNGGDPDIKDPFISSWYLSNITTAKGEKFDYEYNHGNQVSFNTTIEEYSDLDCTVTGQSHEYFAKTKVEASITSSYLKKISSDYGYIMISTLSRQDLIAAKRISELKLYDYNDNPIKTIRFGYSYFPSKENCSEPDCKRLKLDFIDELYPDHNFTKKYQFKYNSTRLPKRGSSEIDHWGYYNVNNQTELIPRGNPLLINQYRTSDIIGAKAGILKKIIYPTGGYTKFNYGLNSFYNNGNKVSGGLRISSVENNDANNGNTITHYNYTMGSSGNSSGIQYTTPDYNSEKTLTYPLNNGGQTVIEYCDGYFIRSSSFNELFDLNGSHIGYGEVKKIRADGSKEINKYTTLTTNPDQRINSDYFQVLVKETTNNNSVERLKNINPYESPYAPPSINNSYQRSKLLEKSIKDANGIEVYKLTNNYEESSNNSLSTKGLRFYTLINMVYAQPGYYAVYLTFNIGKYTESNKNYQLIESIEKTYNGSDFVTKKINYKYSNNHPTLVTEETLSTENSELKRKVLKYPFDISSTINNVLVNKNMIANPVIKETHYSNSDIFIEENIFEYNTANYMNTGNAPLLKTVEYTKGDKQYFNLTIDKYNMDGNIIQYHKGDGVPVTVIWGYGDKYPVAKIENADYSQIYHGTIGLNMNVINSTLTSDTAMRDELNKLRTHSSMKNTLVTTYTYRPLIGMTSTTDPKGNTTYFEYDDFNRVKQIKDKNLNILSDNYYHYKN
ncbi:hypothetical protein OOZ15_05270 [Galbibacter sp. EGI 63066]|uniref:SpvB/TcaC N-terminal domain-containing protein n=1 Tax=Galbibacter sp. EGI 63066 TaxID=2993559 RepID=UPI002248A8DC|nr:SpvB/TcaC N-terminal domain-containing protein [Galbibacter sp. EGI 63066]MCX2679346.1 hypothetical protein [Galbibacter sp. EGI 63066]